MGLNFVSDWAQVGGSKVHIALCDILAVNNSPSEDLNLRFLFFHKNTPLPEYMYGQGPIGLLSSNSRVYSMSIVSSRFFFQKYFVAEKQARWGENF